MQLEMSREGFGRAVERRMHEGLPFLHALYETLDEYQSEEHAQAEVKPACAKNCPMCCYQMITLYPPEMELIWQHLKHKSSREKKAWRERVRRAVQEWMEYYRRNQFSAKIHDPVELAKDWIGKPCPFLEEDGSCGIYEVRPLPCRTVTSPVRCSSLGDISNSKRARQMRYRCEQWANELLTEHFKGFPGVIAIRNLLAMSPTRI